MNEARCSVNWKLFAPDGAQMQFTLRDDDTAAHLALLDSYRAELTARGYTVTEPGLNDGEKQEEISGYVLGESSKGDACVYLYSSKASYKWRIATVYVEKFGELPFRPAGKKWEASAAPERAEAEKKGFLTTVPAFKIVLEAQEADAEVKVHWRFARVVPTASQPTATVSSKPTSPEPASDAEFRKLPSAAEERAANGNQTAAPKLAANRAIMEYGKKAAAFAADYAAYRTKTGVFDDGHIRASILTLGYTEITPANIEEAFAKLAEHALSAEADAASK